MIGLLPTTIEIQNVKYKIRTDYRDILRIIEALQDDELTEIDKCRVIIKVMYIDDIPMNQWQEAINKAIDFINCGGKIQKPIYRKPLYNWEQDEQMIFSALNKVAGTELRQAEYIHYWTFVGYFNEIGDGMFSTVLNIRMKLLKHSKLSKEEREFYVKNKEIIELKRKYTLEELNDLNELEKMLGGESDG